ncbi:MAG: alkaline phosphatase family protein, partial [Bryobacterales bacterium]|nr:alkaline phosphatase family protein [Bryobacterales bacterium]
MLALGSKSCAKAWATALLLAALAHAEVKRVVIIKVDGLPERLVEQYAREPAGPGREGRTLLPWIAQVFGKNGAWLENFYVRGLSLSAPSWSMLDTGRHLEIRGNAEYDRYTLRGHDYLNVVPFFLGYAASRHVDTPGVELLDDRGIPLLLDRFPYREQYEGFQLYQRGVRWSTLEGSLKQSFRRAPKELFDEWQTGFTLSHSVNDQMEQELITNLANPRIRYLDYFTGGFDHVAHLTVDRDSQLHAIQDVDSLIGRVWAAINKSPLAATTALVVVSDHGMNTAEGIYSQGYNLVDWFNSAAGGGQHVLTNRFPMSEFKIWGLDPLVSEVITPSKESTYLAGQTQYPTVTMELDGNEKAGISLRNNDLNVLQILLDQLARKRVHGKSRAAVLNLFFATLDRVRPVWRSDLDELDQEITALRKCMDADQAKIQDHPKQWTPEQKAEGFDKAVRRAAAQIESWRAEALAYERYRTIMTRLLALTPADFDLGNFKMEELIPPHSLGPANSVYDLRHYVVGLAPGGVAIAADGAVDFEKSFRTVDYFPALAALSVRNNVQRDVDPQPVDFLAVPLPSGDAVWLYASEEKQAVIRRRPGASGSPELQYLPVSHLTIDRTGGPDYEEQEWGPGFPLHIIEDPEFHLGEAWLREWHTEREWLEAVHRTKYSNGIIGLTEGLLVIANKDPVTEGRRDRLRNDFFVFARDHWNFNVRSFNPGGNHGSFLRVSTNSVFLIAGGDQTGIPRGLKIQTPYDSLSFVPTILALMNRPEP